MIDLSIIVITYNHKKYIKECLDSVLSQKTDYKYEVIVIDDCSDDGTSEIIKSYTGNNPDKIFHYRCQENIGHGRKAMFALNPPVAGRYWCHLEGDDFWISGQKIEKQVRFLDEHPDFIGCTHNYIIYDEQEDKKTEHGAFLNEWTIEDMTKGQYPLYSHTTTLVWRNIYHKPEENNLHLPPKMNEPYTYGDTCLSFFMANHGGRIKRLNEAMTCYRVTGTGAWSQLSKSEQDKFNQEVYGRLDKITNYKFTEYFKNRKNGPNVFRKTAGKIFEQFPFIKEIFTLIIKFSRNMRALFHKT